MRLLISVRDVHRWIEGAFYRHGMFVASHPFAIISLVITIAFITCYPLLKMPLPGNAPLMHTTPVEGYVVPSVSSTEQPQPPGEYDKKPPIWFAGPPIAYMQQIVVKSVVSPWNDQRLIQTDAFRTPLGTVFSLLEHINNFKLNTETGEQTVDELCVRVSESRVGSEIMRLLPQYNCLIVSPANLWRNDKASFDNDGDIIKSIFKKRSPGIDTPPSFKDLMFGVADRDTGVKKFYMRNRQRVISYAVTIVLQKYDQQFIDALHAKLLQAFPQHVNHTRVQQLVHIHYTRFYLVEYAPLILTYALLFMYLYFSVRKIEMVKSKWGLAFSAVIMVLASLLMSVSICLFFGLNPSLNGSEIFPYLVMIIGLENTLVVTKSVVSTPVHLDVKLRVAQGISKEGWYIFKHLMTELAILAIGFLTFVPAIQEFCLLAVVGLFTDFFLQMFFFTTVLSIDIRRMELLDLHKQSVQQSAQHPEMPYQHFSSHRLPTAPVSTHTPTNFSTHAHRPVMALRIDTGEYLQELVTPPPSPTGKSYNPQLYVPRRVKLLNFWARTRVFQKLLMLCTVIWIGLIVHKAGILDHLSNTTDASHLMDEDMHSIHSTLTSPMEDFKVPSANHHHLDQDRDGVDPKLLLRHNNGDGTSKFTTDSENSETTFGSLNGLKRDESERIPNQDSFDARKNENGENVKNHLHTGVKIEETKEEGNNDEGDTNMNEEKEIDSSKNGKEGWAQDERQLSVVLEHEDKEPWRKLSYQHWPRLFSYYNMSLEGKYMTILPTILLSLPIKMDVALASRHPDEARMVSRLSQYYNMAAKYYDSADGPPKGGASENYDDLEKQRAEMLNALRNRTLSFSQVMKNLAEAPRTRLELISHVVMAFITLFILSYLFMCLYKCFCPKDYGKWRASWYKAAKKRRGSTNYYKQIRESLPLVLDGHHQEIECISVGGPLVVSSCLGGYIKVWESSTGECRTTILRQRKSVTQSCTDNDLETNAMERGDAPEPERTLKHSHSVLQDDQSSALNKRKRHPSKHTRYKSADLSSIRFEDIAPDLTSRIETDFSAQQKLKTKEHNEQLQHEQTKPIMNDQTPCATTLRSPDITHTSPIMITGSAGYTTGSTPSPPYLMSSQQAQNTLLSSHSCSPLSSTGMAINTPSPLSTSSHIASPGGGYSPYSSFSPPFHHTNSPPQHQYQQPSFTFPSSSPSSQDFDASHVLLSDNTVNSSCRDDSSLSNLELTDSSIHSQHGSAGIGQNSKAAKDFGYDFGRFVEDDYEEHKQFLAEKKAYMDIKQHRASRPREDLGLDDQQFNSLSLGESPGGDSGLEVKDAITMEEVATSAVWCVQCQNDIIVAGCGNGTIEFWDGLTGELRFQYCKNNVGITNLCFVGKKVIAARLNGSIDFLELEFSSQQDIPKPQSSSKASKAQKRGHRRMPSSHSVAGELQQWDDIVDCVLIGSAKAHQRTITFLLCRGARLVSASQDYTLKVFRTEDAQCVYTLYGHKGSVSALYIDDFDPACAVSGGEEGAVRLWDLSTGSCLHKLQGHAAPVVSVTGTRSHIVSTGVDDRLCIWDRARATLLHWIQMESGFCNSLSMLTSNLMVSGGQGCLYLWDVPKGEVLRIVELGNQDNCVSVRQIHVIDHSVVVCDYGNQMRVIRFPAVLEKHD